jgi:uncharacterized protein
MSLPVYDREALAALCRRHGIRRLSLVGSVLKGADRSDSDNDLLVEFEPGATPGLIGIAGIEEELSQLMDGRRVDLRTAQDLSRYFREEVFREAEVLRPAEIWERPCHRVHLYHPRVPPLWTAVEIGDHKSTGHG